MSLWNVFTNMRLYTPPEDIQLFPNSLGGYGSFLFNGDADILEHTELKVPTLSDTANNFSWPAERGGDNRPIFWVNDCVAGIPASSSEYYFYNRSQNGTGFIYRVKYSDGSYLSYEISGYLCASMVVIDKNNVIILYDDNNNTFYLAKVNISTGVKTTLKSWGESPRTADYLWFPCGNLVTQTVDDSQLIIFSIHDQSKVDGRTVEYKYFVYDYTASDWRTGSSMSSTQIWDVADAGQGGFSDYYLPPAILGEWIIFMYNGWGDIIGAPHPTGHKGVFMDAIHLTSTVALISSEYVVTNNTQGEWYLISNSAPDLVNNLGLFGIRIVTYGVPFPTYADYLVVCNPNAATVVISAVPVGEEDEWTLDGIVSGKYGSYVVSYNRMYLITSGGMGITWNERGSLPASSVEGFYYTTQLGLCPVADSDDNQDYMIYVDAGVVYCYGIGVAISYSVSVVGLPADNIDGVYIMCVSLQYDRLIIVRKTESVGVGLSCILQD